MCENTNPISNLLATNKEQCKSIQFFLQINIYTILRRPHPTICKCLKHKIYFGSCLPRYKQGRGPLLSCLAKKGTGRSVGDRSLFLPDRFVCLRFYPRWEGKARTYKSLADALLTLLLFIFLQGIFLMTNVRSDLSEEAFPWPFKAWALTVNENWQFQFPYTSMTSEILNTRTPGWSMKQVTGDVIIMCVLKGECAWYLLKQKLQY